MTRAHRKAHLMIWLILAPLLVIGLAAGWLARPAAPPITVPAAIDADLAGER